MSVAIALKLFTKQASECVCVNTWEYQIGLYTHRHIHLVLNQVLLAGNVRFLAIITLLGCFTTSLYENWNTRLRALLNVMALPYLRLHHV